jgi:RNA-directed DNA polymerase
MLRGWFGYFKLAQPAIFVALDGFIRRQLRAVLRKQRRRPGVGRTANDHQRGPRVRTHNQ